MMQHSNGTMYLYHISFSLAKSANAFASLGMPTIHVSESFDRQQGIRYVARALRGPTKKLGGLRESRLDTCLPGKVMLLNKKPK